MNTGYIIGYAPRKHGLHGFVNSTAYELTINSEYTHEYCGAPVAPCAMPGGFDTKCRYCGVEQNYSEIGLCACCGGIL